MLVRFVEGQPISGTTCCFLDWLSTALSCPIQRKPSQEESVGSVRVDIRVLVLFWDNASWHVSRQVQDWVRSHNRRVKKEGGIRLLICRLPVQSPWLNNIEPKWMHGKRATFEEERVLTLEETVDRLCKYYQCEKLEFLTH